MNGTSLAIETSLTMNISSNWMAQLLKISESVLQSLNKSPSMDIPTKTKMESTLFPVKYKERIPSTSMFTRITTELSFKRTSTTSILGLSKDNKIIPTLLDL